MKVQKLVDEPQGAQALSLINETLTFYGMEHSNKIFTSEANLKSDSKRDQLSKEVRVEPADDEPVLLTLLTKFMNSKDRTKP